MLFCTTLPFAYGGCFDEPCILEWQERLVVCIVAMGLVGLYVAVCPWLTDRLGIGKARLDNVVTAALAPLMLIPAALPLANELQFSLSGTVDISPRTIWIGFTLLLIVAAVRRAVVSLRRGPAWRASKLVRNFTFPVLVLTSATFVNFDHFFRVGPAIDMFHWGELVVPVQQLYQFHRIPFVDLLPTHGLRDLLAQLIYTLLNGYRGLEMLLWNSWVNVAAAVVCYFLFARVFSPLFALVFAIGVPICMVFTTQGPDYFMFLAVALFVYRSMDAPTWRRMTALWIVVSGAFWWRYDLGLFSAFACLLLMLGYLKGKSRREWQIVMMPACVLALIQIAIFWVLALVRGRSAPELVLQLWYHLKILASGQGFETIWPAWNAVTFLMYCVLPAVCAGYVIYFVYQRWSVNCDVTAIVYMLVFLAIISLLLSFRNLHRHGMMESYKSLFAVFLIGCIPVLAHISRRFTELAFLALILVHTMVLGTYSWLTLDNSNKLLRDLKRVFALQASSEINFKRGDVFTFHHWHDKETRLRDLSDWQYRAVKSFLDRSLTGKQTFYDFSCATLLYALTDKEAVSFLLQGQVHTGDPVQRYQLERMRSQYDAGGLPFVIFKQGRQWDVLDGVPNELRSYLIAEFIYRHYRPLGYAGSFQVWTANGIDEKSRSAEEPRQLSLPLLKDFEAKNSAKIDGGGTELAWRSLGPQTSARGFVDLRGVPALDGEHYWFLRLVCRSSARGQLSAYFVRPSLHGQASAIGFSSRADVEAASHGTWREVMFPIPISSKGQPDSLGDIILHTVADAEFEIKSADILSTPDPLFPRISHVEQRLDFGALPLLWARYDPDGAWQKTPVLASNQVRQVCSPGHDVPVPFDHVIDKETGNFLQLRIQSDQATRATVIVPGDPESWITFTVAGSPEPRDYIIRISCLYAWMSAGNAQVVLQARQPVWVEDVIVRKGD